MFLKKKSDLNKNGQYVKFFELLFSQNKIEIFFILFYELFFFKGEETPGLEIFPIPLKFLKKISKKLKSLISSKKKNALIKEVLVEEVLHHNKDFLEKVK